MQENESNEPDKPTQDEQIREYGQVVLNIASFCYPLLVK